MWSDHLLVWPSSLLAALFVFIDAPNISNEGKLVQTGPQSVQATVQTKQPFDPTKIGVVQTVHTNLSFLKRLRRRDIIKNIERELRFCVDCLDRFNLRFSPSPWAGAGAVDAGGRIRRMQNS